MTGTDYGYGKQVSYSYDEAIERVKDALREEGFGVLTEIDVKATLKAKLDVDVDRYIILGACNPNLAFRALQQEERLGLLLPCNAIVYERAGHTFVAFVDPLQMLGVVRNPALDEIAREADARLRRVLATV